MNNIDKDESKLSENEFYILSCKNRELALTYTHSLFHTLFLTLSPRVTSRQWVKSEEISSLAVWFPKKELEKQVSLSQSCLDIVERSIAVLVYTVVGTSPQ